MVGEFAHHVERQQPIVQELRRLLEDVMAEVEGRAAAQQKNAGRAADGPTTQTVAGTGAGDGVEEQDRAGI